MTFTAAKAIVSKMGFTLRHKDGEYVLRHKGTGFTYHTSNQPSDLVDIVGTAMAEHVWHLQHPHWATQGTL